ncbi:MAG: acetyltransferase [Syntrophorhabdus sp.]|nr:acetyltransferase [Syntrophorhabdus sp.]
MSNGVFVLGGGGHAKVVAGTLMAAGATVLGIIDDDPAKWGQRILGNLVSGPRQFGPLRGKTGVIAIGDNSIRERLALEIENVEWRTVVHPHAHVDPSASIGEGTVVFAGAVVQPDVVIGRHCIINTGASIDHDCVIGDFAHIGPGATLAGNVSVGKGAFHGAGSVATPGVKVGRWSIVGAGGVVTADIPDNATAAGVPARVLTFHDGPEARGAGRSG